MESYWLVRTANHQIAGPYTKQVLSALILEKKLELEDEICEGNKYWFYLTSFEDVAKFFESPVLESLKNRFKESLGHNVGDSTTQTEIPVVAVVENVKPALEPQKPRVTVEMVPVQDEMVSSINLFKGLTILLIGISILLFLMVIRVLKT